MIENILFESERVWFEIGQAEQEKLEVEARLARLNGELDFLLDQAFEAKREAVDQNQFGGVR